MPEMHVGAADLGQRRPQENGAGRQIGTRKFAQLDRLPRPGHHRSQNAIAHAVYVILERMLIQTASALWLVAALGAPRPGPTAVSRVDTQVYHAAKARRHFISITFDRQSVQAYSFGKHPLSDL